MNLPELIKRLRRRYTMSMVATRSMLYDTMNVEREEAAEALEQLVAALMVKDAAISKAAVFTEYSADKDYLEHALAIQPHAELVAKKMTILTDEKIKELAHRRAWRYKKSSDPHHSDTYTFNDLTLGDFARAIESAVREELAKQEPVAWMNPYGGVLQRLDTGLERETYTIPLYAAPVVQPDKYEALTTMLEGALAHAEVFGNGNISTEVIRKLIAAAQESNAEVNGGRLADRPSEAV